MEILPHHLNTFVLFGITLLLGLIGGQIARRIRFFPKISAYILMGFILGPSVLNLLGPSVLSAANIFVDISLGIILFELGRHLDFTWLKEDHGLLYSSLLESGLSFFLPLLFAHFYAGFSWLSSALAASFIMATSPAVVLMVANDLHSEGPVTRRTLALTSLNNLFALTLFVLLLPLTLPHSTKIAPNAVEQALYSLFASFVLGTFMFFFTSFLARIIGKEKEGQYILFIAVLICTIGIAQLFKLPVALALFIFGVATRNLDKKHILMEINFGWSSQLFFILLFVITGTYLRLDGLKFALVTILLLILLRAFSKTIGLAAFARKSRVTMSQVFAISLALTPMAGLAISLSLVLRQFNPELSTQISLVISAMVGILEILGPIATQFAFLKSKETLSDKFE